MQALTPAFLGQVAIVTGGGSGIGAAAAKAFAAQGATVVLAGRRESNLQDVAEHIRGEGGQARSVAADLTDESAVRHLVDVTVDQFGRLDIAFNNAGSLGEMKSIVEATAGDFDDVMAVNLRSVWLLMKYEIEAMTPRERGVIVNTSSFVAEAAGPGTSVYAASKAALNAMIRAVALEAGPSGIRVNNVAPGVIHTPMSSGIDESTATAIAEHSAVKRLGEPEDIADVAVWLCTDGARFVTGQTIVVDGGYTVPGLR